MVPLTRRAKSAPTSPRKRDEVKKRNSRRLRKRSLGFGEGPVDPARQQCNVVCLHRGAAPDAQAGRRVAIMREIVTGAFLLHERDELLGEVGLSIRRQ